MNCEQNTNSDVCLDIIITVYFLFYFIVAEKVEIDENASQKELA